MSNGDAGVWTGHAVEIENGRLDDDLQRCSNAIAAASDMIAAIQAKLSEAQVASELMWRHILEIRTNNGEPSHHSKNINKLNDLLTLPELEERLGITRQTIWRLRKRGNFPQPIKALSPKVVRFRLSEIEKWLKNS